MKWYYRKKRCKAWIDWRTKARERDNYTCVLCGKAKKIMDPHHILPKSLFPKLKYVLSNCATLCRSCHRKTFRKELEFVEQIVTKLFGGMDKWILSKHLTTPKKQRTGFKKPSIPSMRVIALLLPRKRAQVVVKH